MFNIEENLKQLPLTPGVYIHKDKLGQVIYVGKAINLRRRVSQYFHLKKDADPKVRAMVSHIAEFEYINCATEMEALILENNLIKKYAPKYNILLRDDKTYPYIKVTVTEKFPRVLKTRDFKEDGSKYFGPYSDVKAVNETVDLLQDRLALKRCSAVAFPPGMRPCLNYHIGACKGICQGNVTEEEYAKQIETALAVLSGKDKKLVAELTAAMNAASEDMRFEEAAQFRDRIAALKALGETQRAAIPGMKDIDVVLAVKTTKETYAVAFFYREGKLVGRETYPMQADEGDGNPEIVSAFIKQYYGIMPTLPYEIVVSHSLPEQELIEEYLESIAGRKVSITVPQRGEKKALLALAQRDCLEMCKTIDERAALQAERVSGLSDELYALVSPHYPGLSKKSEYRIESYDISNTNGVDTVAGMVVFQGLRPMRKDYRRFKIKTVQGPDDYASLHEVITRRFRRGLAEDSAFGVLPDLLLIDGGKGQVTVVLDALRGLEEETGKKIDIPVVGMAKDDHHRTNSAVIFTGGEWHETELAGKSLLFRFMGTVQEEVHRFAIEYHRNLRGKHMIGSVLDEIPGIGPKKRNSLLAHFKSVEAIRSASLEDLEAAPGITRANAEAIHAFFSKK